MTQTMAIRLGVVSAIMFAIGNAIWALGWPPSGSSDATMASFYADRQVRIEIGGAVSAISLALWAPFAAMVALRIARTNRILAVSAGLGASVLLTGGIAAETINAAGAIRASHDPALAQILYEVPQVLGAYTSGVGLGIVAISIALARILRRDWSAITLVIGVALLTPASLLVREFAGAAFVFISINTALCLRADED